jgi:glycerol-3-phosphate dehydrogenase
MKRDLGRLESTTFDLCVIGGGIIGACLARDAARRGLSVALVEVNDFASAASEAMSHMIHGGIRYLAQGRIGLVREAMAEKAVWLQTAPDFVTEQKFIMPLGGGLSALKMKAGIALYQRLGGRRAAFHSAGAALELEPSLARPDLSGAAAYDDARVDDPERLIIAILQDAAAHGAVIANHVECTGLASEDGGVAGLHLTDCLTGAQFQARAAYVVNASGPWAERLASRLLPGQKQARLTASKGIHILTPPLSNNYAIAVSGRGEHGFVLPWKGMSLVGTSDEAFNGDAGSAQASEQEIASLVEKITLLLPQAQPFLDQRLGSFAGVRALPGAPGDTYRASRDIAVCDHSSDGMSGLFTVFGGKWTTARLISEQFLNQLAPRFSRPLQPCETASAAIRANPAAQNLAARLAQAADREMAVTQDDHARRIGRADMLAAPRFHQDIKAWLATQGNSRNSALGQ